jgi:uncharacterized membrane protein
MLHLIAKRELLQAQVILFFAIALQVIVWDINRDLFGLPYLAIVAEIFFAILIGFTATRKSLRDSAVHHGAAVLLLALISLVNLSSLIIVLHSLVISHYEVTGLQLLTAAIAIFVTNIIVYALWYWEIDSPGLTRTRWSKHDKDFQFIQQDLANDFPKWQPEFLDYLYLSVTNAINFAPADTRPVTRQAKMLMASQALISVFTLALVIARSVSILE